MFELRRKQYSIFMISIFLIRIKEKANSAAFPYVFLIIPSHKHNERIILIDGD